MMLDLETKLAPFEMEGTLPVLLHPCLVTVKQTNQASKQTVRSLLANAAAVLGIRRTGGCKGWPLRVKLAPPRYARSHPNTIWTVGRCRSRYGEY
jgi:hypothetical protein